MIWSPDIRLVKMNNDELLDQIEEASSSGENKQQLVEDKTVKVMVFLVDEKKYAFYAEDIREIILDYPLFFVPFVPPYVRGFLNRHGEPYTVLDLNVLFDQVRLESSTFLVLNRDSDQLAVIITEILEIVKIPEKDIHLVSSDTGEEGYFLGSITSEGKETFIVDVEKVLDRLARDVAAG